MRRLRVSIGLLVVFSVLATGTSMAGAHEDKQGRNGKHKNKKEQLTLRCEPRSADGRPAVACSWAQSERRGFASYALIRQADGSERKPVFRTRDREQTRYADPEVRAGKYVYVVEARNRDGKVIGRSKPSKVECCPSASASSSPTTTARKDRGDREGREDREAGQRRDGRQRPEGRQDDNRR